MAFLKKTAAAIMSLGFSLLLMAFVCIIAIFMGAYELPVKAVLAAAVPLALLLFIFRVFERKAGYGAFVLLAGLCAAFLLMYSHVLNSFMEGPLYMAPDVDRQMFKDEKVLILSPHQDDEMNMLAGTISEYTRSGSEVYVVYSTCGDSIFPVEYRWPEAIKVLEAQGIAEENVIFLGYGDSYEGEHLYDGDENALKSSYSGRTETFGMEGTAPYREGREYTKKNFLEDLEAVILDIRPSIIYCVDYDLHEDHRALSLAFEDVMGKILRREDYCPLVMKVFAYSTGWNADRDYHRGYNVGATVNKYPTDYMQENNIYLWSERIRLPVRGNQLARYVQNSELYKTLFLFQTQGAAGNAEGIVNSDRVVWQRSCESLSYKSSISASSGNAELLNDFALADGGRVRGDIDYAVGTWIPDKNDGEKTLRMEFDGPTRIERVCLYDNPSMEDNVLEARISFDGGSSMLTGPLAPNGSATSIETGEKYVTSIEISLVDWEGEEAGLTEVEIYDAPAKAPFSMIKLCADDGNFVYDYLSAEEEIFLELYRLGIGDELSEEHYEINLDNSECSVEFADGRLRLICPKGERCSLEICHTESGERDSISVCCMKNAEKIKNDFERAVFEKYKASLEYQRQSIGWIEKYNALASLLQIVKMNLLSA